MVTILDHKMPFKDFILSQLTQRVYCNMDVIYTIEATYERSEYKSAGGSGGAVTPPRIFFEFRTPESESERNMTNYLIICLLLFYSNYFLKIFVMIIDLISFRYLKIIMKQSTIFVNPIQ